MYYIRHHLQLIFEAISKNYQYTYVRKLPHTMQVEAGYIQRSKLVGKCYNIHYEREYLYIEHTLSHNVTYSRGMSDIT